MFGLTNNKYIWVHKYVILPTWVVSRYRETKLQVGKNFND